MNNSNNSSAHTAQSTSNKQTVSESGRCASTYTLDRHSVSNIMLLHASPLLFHCSCCPLRRRRWCSLRCPALLTFRQSVIQSSHPHGCFLVTLLRRTALHPRTDGTHGNTVRTTTTEADGGRCDRQRNQ
jgi:hypothetical protein